MNKLTTHRQKDIDPIRIKTRDGITVLEGPPDLTVRLDAAGHWCLYHRNGVFYRRTLDGKIIVQTPYQTRKAINSEKKLIFFGGLEVLKRLFKAITDQKEPVSFFGNEISTPILEGLIQKGLSWKYQDFLEEEGRFKRAYPEPVNILPPDRYRDLVVLPALWGAPMENAVSVPFIKTNPLKCSPRVNFRNMFGKLGTFSEVA